MTQLLGEDIELRLKLGFDEGLRGFEQVENRFQVVKRHPFDPGRIEFVQKDVASRRVFDTLPELFGVYSLELCVFFRDGPQLFGLESLWSLVDWHLQPFAERKAIQRILEGGAGRLNSDEKLVGQCALPACNISSAR